MLITSWTYNAISELIVRIFFSLGVLIQKTASVADRVIMTRRSTLDERKRDRERYGTLFWVILCQCFSSFYARAPISGFCGASCGRDPLPRGSWQSLDNLLTILPRVRISLDPTCERIGLVFEAAKSMKMSALERWEGNRSKEVLKIVKKQFVFATISAIFCLRR